MRNPYVRLICAVVCVFTLAGCGKKSVAEWLEKANTVDEIRVAHACSIAAENIDKALEYRRANRLLPMGSTFAPLEPREGECARYVVYSALFNDPEAVIALERRDDGDTTIIVYQMYGSSTHSRQFIADIEGWTNGFYEMQ